GDRLPHPAFHQRPGASRDRRARGGVRRHLGNSAGVAESRPAAIAPSPVVNRRFAFHLDRVDHRHLVDLHPGRSIAVVLDAFFAPAVPRRFEQRRASWLLGGLLMGLAFDSKYSGAFLQLGLVLFLALSPSHRRWLKTPWPYLCLASAHLAMLPVYV